MAKISRRKLADHIAAQITAGSDRSHVMRELGAYLMDTRRLHETELIVRDIEIALLGKGIAIVTTTAARSLTDEAKQTITEFVKSQYDGLKTVVVRETIDETVIGGVNIKLPDAQFDGTVRTKLEKLTVN